MTPRASPVLRSRPPPGGTRFVGSAAHDEAWSAPSPPARRAVRWALAAPLVPGRQSPAGRPRPAQTSPGSGNPKTRIIAAASARIGPPMQSIAPTIANIARRPRGRHVSASRRCPRPLGEGGPAEAGTG